MRVGGSVGGAFGLWQGPAAGGAVGGLRWGMTATVAAVDHGLRTEGGLFGCGLSEVARHAAVPAMRDAGGIG